jgi:hypothetical protein
LDDIKEGIPTTTKWFDTNEEFDMHRKKVKKRISEYAKVNGTENISQIQEQKEVYKVYKAMGGKEGKFLRY